MRALVEMRGITKKFLGVTALENISFDIKPGEVHVLLGENGAGKSTLMKILSGVYEPSFGEILIDEKKFNKLTPKESKENGIGIIYQELSVINELSIRENLFVGKMPCKSRLGLSVIDYKYIDTIAQELCSKVGLKRDIKTLVEDLSISEKQQVEIAKALASNAKVIIMDEPTTSLTLEETNHLFKIIRQLKSEGKGIVYISHKMKELKEIGDRVTVLKDGCYVGTHRVEDIEIDVLISMMVGRKVQTKYNNLKKDFNEERTIFEVKNLSRKDARVKDVSFKVRKGEIVGFAGLVGSGRSELMTSIFGADNKSSGKIFIDGAEVNIKNPYSAIKNSMAMMHENRREVGFIDTMDIKSNISLLSYIKNSRCMGTVGLLDNVFEENIAKQQIENLRIKCLDMNQNILELSGGNQQKVILGKWIAADSKIIIFDEPTKGIDVGSKGEIYELMRRLSDEERAVIVVSSELPELLSICDTIFVFKNGKIAKTLNIEEATEEIIMKISTNETGKVV